MKHLPIGWWASREVLHLSKCCTTVPSLHDLHRIRDNISAEMAARRSSTKSGLRKSSPVIADSMPIAARFASGGTSGGGNSLHTPAWDRADDFNTGFHLEVGETVATDMSAGLEGTPLDDLPARRTRRGTQITARPVERTARVKGWVSSTLNQIGANGVSGYPAPSISRAKWGRPMAKMKC